MTTNDIVWIVGFSLITLLILVTVRAMIDEIKYRRAQRKKRITEGEGFS